MLTRKLQEPFVTSLVSAPPPSVESKSSLLDRALVNALAWTGTVKWLAQLLSWASTVVVARLLKPEDYGIVAMAGVFLGLISVFSEFGIGTAVVTLRDLTKEQIEKIYTLALLVGGGAFVAVCLIAGSVGELYRSSEVPGVMVVAGIGLLLGAMRSVQSALLEKELKFKTLALLEGVQAVIATVTTVLLAWFGWGYWALVLGVLMGGVFMTCASLVLRPIRIVRLSFHSIRDAAMFSTQVLMARLSWYVASSSDVFIGGRLLGQSGVGVYAFAGTIANIPLDKITALFSRVMPAFYSSVQLEKVALRKYLLLLTEGIAALTFPAGLGMALVAQDVVMVLFGEKWEGAVGPLQVLSCWAAIRSVTGLWQPIIVVTGGARLSMMNGLLCAVVFPTAFWVGSGWGATGLAVGWVVGQPLTWIAPFRHLLFASDLSVRQYLEAMKPAFIGVVAMGLCVYGFRENFLLEVGAVSRLVCEVGIGTFIYAGVTLLLYRKRMQVFREILMGQISR